MAAPHAAKGPVAPDDGMKKGHADMADRREPLAKRFMVRRSLAPVGKPQAPRTKISTRSVKSTD